LNVTDAIIHFVGDGSSLSHLNASNVDFGRLTTSVLPLSTVTPGRYGDFSNVSQVTIDQYGRVINATNVAMTSSQWTGLAGDPIYYVPNVSIGAPVQASAKLQVTGNAYVSGNVNVDDTLVVTGAMTSNASNTTFLFDTFTIPYINTQYLNVASNIVLTGNLSAPLANITTLNVNYLTVNSAVVYGTSTLNVYGVSNLSTVTAQTMNVYGDCFIGNTAITGSVQTTTGPMSRLTFDNTANTSIYPNKIVLYANTASSQYCGFGVTGIGPTGGASISYGARANHIFYTGTTLSTEVMRITSGSTVGVGTTTPTAKFHVVGNIYASNSVTTTNLHANTMSLIGTTGQTTIDVTGNVYASNAITTTNVFTTNVTATGIQTIAGLAGLTSLNVTGNVYASNALTTTNVFTNNVTATGIQTIAGLAGRTSLNVTGNVYVSNAITTTNVFTTNVTATGIQTIAGLAGRTSLNVTGNVYVSNAITTTNVFTTNVTATGIQTIAGLAGLTSLNVTGNVYVSNAVTTTNVFAATETLTGTTGQTTLNVTGNLYVSNAITTTNLTCAGFTSNVSNTIFNYSTLTIPFVYATTLNVASTSNLDVVTITGEPGLTSLNVTGNAFVSNALTTTNVFASDIILASSTLGTVVAGQMEYNTYLYGTINTTSGRGSVPIDYIYRLTTPTAAYGIASNNFFTGTATGTGARLNLEASSVYDIEAYCYFTKTTAGTVTWILATSSAPTLITAAYTASPITGISGGTPVTSYVGGVTTAVTFQTTGSLSSGVSHSFLFKIQVLTNLATTFGITATQSDGTMTSLAGSYYRVTKLSTTTGVFA
jgi:hypothetical protein